MTRNDITGDRIATKPASDAFREGFDRIFGKPEKCVCEHGNCRAFAAQGCRDWNKRVKEVGNE